MAARRSLWPREHGAYGQLAAPLAGALLVHVPTFAAIALAVAACLAFLANEPLLVVLGQRGERMRASHGAAATRRLVVLLAGAAACALAGLARSSVATLEIAAVAAVPGACLVALAWSRRQHTLYGELLAAIAFSAAAAPVMVAAGVPVGEALAIWAAWALGYASSVAAVHRVLVRHRHPATWIDRALALGFAGGIVTAIADRAVWPFAAVAVPLAVVALALVVKPPRATRMRAVGVILVIASAVADVLLVARC